MASDIFLKIEGIKGESEDSKHGGEIELLSWSWGESNTSSSTKSSGAGAGRVQMQDFHFTMSSNKSSPHLFLHCANGKHITKAELSCRKAGGKQQDFLKIFFEDLMVTSFQVGGTGGHSDSLPTEQVAINFTKIKYQYSAQKPDGSLDSPIVFGYDLRKQVSS
ncbi:MAG TPA: type VI secretion system tube protein Hcp [Lacunisphaera sp.]|nr:type VI secretion system tube protein Hcp [Lacunisphaera sp.]